MRPIRLPVRNLNAVSSAAPDEPTFSFVDIHQQWGISIDVLRYWYPDRLKSVRPNEVLVKIDGRARIQIDYDSLRFTRASIEAAIAAVPR